MISPLISHPTAAAADASRPQQQHPAFGRRDIFIGVAVRFPRSAGRWNSGGGRDSAGNATPRRIPRTTEPDSSPRERERERRPSGREAKTEEGEGEGAHGKHQKLRLNLTINTCDNICQLCLFKQERSAAHAVEVNRRSRRTRRTRRRSTTTTRRIRRRMCLNGSGRDLCLLPVVASNLAAAFCRKGDLSGDFVPRESGCAGKKVSKG